jgi:ABC-type uncharacterized transport system substrate-binding protein
MDRRAFIAGSLGLLAAPLAAGARPAGTVYRIGFLGPASATSYAKQVGAFRQGLRELGYSEGKNITIEYRWADDKYDRLPDLAAELVRLKVDLIVTYGTPGTLAAQRATTTIPIVMAAVGDAVTTGLVASVARPGGNITGSAFFFAELNAKRLELLKQVLPRATRVAVLLNPQNPAHRVALETMEAVATELKLELQRVEVRGPDEFEAAFSAMAERRASALAVVDDPMLRANARRVAALAAMKRLPSIGFKEYAEGGGLMAYAADLRDMFRRAAVFVDRILKGARPGDLPVEQATRFELVVNMRTARALGVTIPQSVLLRADEVIE